MSAAHDPPSPASVEPSETVHPNGKAKETFWRKTVSWMTVSHKDKGKWLEDMRGILSLVSTVIASMTYQSTISPPGGVLQESDGIIIYDRFQFQLYNTISFIASLSVTLLLVSGIPLNHTFPMWVLSIGMIVTLTFLALTYAYALYLNFPHWSDYEVFTMVPVFIFTWITLAGIIALLLTVRFVVWLVNKSKGLKHSQPTVQMNLEEDFFQTQV